MSDKYIEYLEAHAKEEKRMELSRAFTEANLKEIKKIRDSFRNDSFEDALITYEQLENMPFYEWFVLDGTGVKFMRIENDTIPVYFITIMNPKLAIHGVAKFGVQWHDCKEIGKVIIGELIEPYENKKRYAKNDTFIYPAKFIHKPYSNIYAIYEIEFQEPELVVT